MSSSYQKGLTFYQHKFFRFFIAVSIVISQVEAKKNGLNNSISAILVFGDSTADPGNNNYIMTPFKSNFSPYGRDFPGQNPTGRFTNGRLASDFIAKYVGIKEFVPPYLDPTLSNEELLTGVSFASAASGFDPLTPKISNVISLSKQLEYFKEYQKRLEHIIGKTRTKILINNALYLVSVGTNDFVVNYFTLPIRQKMYTLPNYMEFLLQQVQQFMQGLWDQGARKIAVYGLSPIGCLPIVITLKSDNAILKRGCVEFFSSVAKDFNIMLENELNAMQLSLADYGARICYMDTYGPLSEIIQGHNFGMCLGSIPHVLESYVRSLQPKVLKPKFSPHKTQETSLEGQEANVITDYVLKILELEDCANSIVCDEMIRGISGGERK